MPTQTANRPAWNSTTFGNDYAMQQPQQQQNQLYQNQLLQGTHIDLQPRRNSPMRNQPSSMRGGYPTVSHSERIPIMTADGRYVSGAMPQSRPQPAPAAQNIPIRQPLYHHPPILPTNQHGPLVPQRAQMPGQFSPPPTQQQQAQFNATTSIPSASAIPSSSHPNIHAQAAQSPAAQPMWFGGGKAPAGYEAAPIMSTVPFSSASHPVIQVAPHPSPFPMKIHEAMRAEPSSASSTIPMPAAAPPAPHPHPFLKAHSSQGQRISPSRMSSTMTNIPQHTSIPIQRTDHVIGSSSANIKPGMEPRGFPGPNIRGGYGAQPSQQRMPMGQPMCQPGMPCSPHHPQNALPMWFGDGPTPQFYQRPTEPWHFTYNGKEPIAKAPTE